MLVEVKDYDYICSQITVFKMFFLPCYYTEKAQSTKQIASLKLQHTFFYCHQKKINHKKIEPLKYPAESPFRDKSEHGHLEHLSGFTHNQSSVP